MADPFDDVWQEIGEDFGEFAEGQPPVTVRQIDPDIGGTLTEVECVTALKRPRKRQRLMVGAGELGSDQCRFILKADQVEFTMKQRDQIVEEGGTVWEVETAQLIGFGQLWACDVTIKRS